MEVENFRFTLSNPFKPNPELTADMINFLDMHLKNINAKAKDAHFISNSHDTLTTHLISLYGVDKSGYKVENLSGDIKVTSKQAKIENAYLTDGYSVLNADYFYLAYSNAKSFKYFLDSVALGCKFSESVLNFRTIGSMAPSMHTSTLKLNIGGEIIGPIRRLTGERLTATTTSGQTIATLTDVVLAGLPNPAITTLNANVENAVTNGKDLAALLAELTATEKIPFFNNMPELNIFTYKGKISGTLLNLTTEGTAAGAGGTVNFATTVNTIDHALNVTGNYSVDSFNAGTFLSNSSLGKISATGNYSVSGKGKNMVVSIDTIFVKSAELLGRTLVNTSASGKYADGDFTGKVSCKDPKLTMTFDGVIPVVADDNRNYKGVLNLQNVDLDALGIDSSGRNTAIQMKVVTDFNQTQENEFIGYANIYDAKICLNSSTYNLGDIKFTSDIEAPSYNYVMNLNSDFLKASYIGENNITDFIKKTKQLILQENFSNLVKLPEKEYEELADANYNLSVQTFNTRPICALLCEGLYVQSGTHLRINISDENKYNVLLSSGRVALDDNYLKNIDFIANNYTGDLNAKFFSKDVVLSGFKVDSTRINLKGSDNKFDLGVNFHNDTTGENQTNLFSTVEFEPKAYKFSLKNSDIMLKGAKWNINPAVIKLTDSIVYVNHLNIVNGAQSLKVNGSISQTLKDSLGVSMENFDISIVDQFLSKPFELKGYLSGRGIVSLNRGNTRMYAGFTGDSISIYNSMLGKAQILSRWNQSKKYYDLLFRTINNDNVTCDVRGFYRPQDNYLDINSTLNDLSLTYFEPILSSVITNTSGSVKGKIRLYGPVDNLTLTGTDCRFDNFKFILDYTKVPYTLNGPIEITESGIKLKNNTITDNFNGTAIATGGVTYKNFKDIQINTRLRLNNLHVLSTTEEDNSDFYGDAFATGTVDIKGDMNLLNLNITAQSEPKTFIHIPISKASNASSKNLLTFIEREKVVEVDPYDTLYVKKEAKRSTPMKVGVNLNVTANDNADIWLEVDKNNGDIIKARGNGNVKIGVNGLTNDFTLNGNYIINQGSYHFVLMNIASRDFTIQDGSSVTMNGRPDNIDLNITGTYKTKAAVNYLISDTTGVNTTRMVQANIYIKGKLSAPQISFGIDIPDLDPTTKAKVQSALNTEEKIQKQVAALLVSGGFMPDLESGISQSSSNMLYSNVSALISSQVGNILEELGIPLDLGINYVPGEKNASDAFEVALSTQLFDNRVSVNGNIGNDPYADYNGRNVIGNIDVDIKMDQKGRVKLNLFSHSTDRYSNDLEESQRSGVGVSYQREFNSFKDLFRRRSPQQKEYDKMLKAREKEQRAKLKAEKKAQKEAEKEAKKQARAKAKAQKSK